MKKIALILTIICVSIISINAQTLSKTSNSSLKFKIKNAGINVNGKFKTVTYKASYNPANPSASSFSGVAKVATVSTGIGLRDSHIKEKEEFFNVAKYATITMKSYKVVKVSDTKMTVYWKLTMKGITKNIKTTVNVKKNGSGYDLSTAFKINRRDWKVGGSSFTMSDNLTVYISTTVK